MGSKLQIFMIAFLTYALFEATVTYLYVQGHIEPHSIWFMEKSPDDHHIRFSNKIGYEISRQPHVFGCYNTNAGVVSSGLSQGNNYGFPDLKDFTPQKQLDKKRVLLLGDSFSAGQYIKTNWPQHLENLQNKKPMDGKPKEFEIYNMSLDGGGLANWWLTLKNIIEQESFEADALVIMALNENFTRSFMWWDDSLSEENKSQPPHFMYLNYQKDWKHKNFPQKREELAGFPAHLFHLIPPSEVEELMSGHRTLPTQRPYHPYLLTKLARELASLLRLSPVFAQEPLITESEQRQMLGDFAVWSQEKDIPIYVVFFDKPHPDHKFILKALSAQEISPEGWLDSRENNMSELFIPLDGHLNQKGARLWAEHMLTQLRQTLWDSQDSKD